ncbi:MAG TPA: HEAT repeat domain-containing protein [Thermoanaerobaculia bacterium]|nr:HEAT repeat domain-containing protein [Thermoanaerobaculia bacterium]
MKTRTISAIAVFCIALTADMHACSCAGPGPPAVSFKGASAVFRGRVTHIERKVRLDVSRSWKGVKTKTIEVDRWRGCGFERFAMGKEFLVYADGPQLFASMCGRTKEADHVELESELLDILAKGGKEEPFLRRLPEVLAKDPRPSARAEAARLLARDAPRDVAAAARAVVLRALDDPSPIVRRAVIETLYVPYFDLTTPAADIATALLKRLGDRDAAVRREAARVLQQYAPVAHTDGALRAAWKVERDPEVISALASAIAMRGSRQSKRIVLPLLLRELKSAQDPTRWNAAEKLGAIGADATSAIASLAAASRDPQNLVRLYAARALGEIGSRNAVPALIAALRDERANVRAQAALAIYKIGDDANVRKAAVPVLIKDLEDESDRFYAVQTLEELGPRATSAVPALQELLRKTTDRSTHDSINRALEEITMVYKPLPVREEPLEKTSVLIARLNDAKARPWDRCRAAESLRRIGTPEARAAFDKFAAREIPLLVAWLRDRARKDRGEAARCLVHLAPRSRDALTPLAHALEDDDWLTRTKSAEALGALGPAAAPAVPALTRLLEDRNRYARRAAVEALAKIRKAPPV